ncbi:MAG: polyphosphate kinase 1 [Flavobacteriia bacterium]|nr:polyphosphate kinase 1 [Flavobacteriia bacterium]
MDLFNRELSWLSFNERVLQEAMDVRVPLIERVRFLGIYSNNLDEFFRVRVANLRKRTLVDHKQMEGFNGTPKQLYEKIRGVVLKHQKQFELTYLHLFDELSKEKIQFIDENQLNEIHKIQLNEFFNKELKHEIVPILLNSKIPFPRLKEYGIYLAVKMISPSKKKPTFALIEIPNEYPRFYRLKDKKKEYFILLDDIIRVHLKNIFSIFDFEKIEAYTFKFTRDAELDLDDDLSISFIEKIEKSVKQRKKAEPIRFVYDSHMPRTLLNFLIKSLKLKEGMNMIPGGKYHNFKDFINFPDFGRQDLIYPKRPALAHPDLENKASLLKVIQEKDIMLHFPYQQFDYIVDILREAAIDPFVKSIKINVYRVANHSQVMNALLNAVSNGKEVVVIMELQARFDETNNVYWSNRLKENGVKVIYGIQNLKIHSKLIQIQRVVNGRETLISYIGTGNFNEKTARIYTDLGILTCKPKISNEIKKVFKLLENHIDKPEFKELMVSPFNTRSKIISLINNEIRIAKKTNNGLIRLKINNLVDAKIIDKLYEASCAGVKIQLIVRGVCCLVAGLQRKSENIEVISIVDRYLEHARFMIFGNNGKPKYYLSSADWMERNLDKRIEVGCPVIDLKLKKELNIIFDYQWKGNYKSRIIDKKQKNQYRNNHISIPFHAQEELYNYYRKLNDEKLI